MERLEKYKVKKVKKIPISFLIDENVKKSIEKYAQDDERSLSQYVSRILRDHVESKEKTNS